MNYVTSVAGATPDTDHPPGHTAPAGQPKERENDMSNDKGRHVTASLVEIEGRAFHDEEAGGLKRIELRVPSRGVVWAIAMDPMDDQEALDRQSATLAYMLDNASELVSNLLAHANREAEREAVERLLENLEGLLDEGEA